MEKVLVLGINGFTGLHLDRYILKNSLAKDFEFLGVDKVIDNRFNIKCIKMDLLKVDVISNLMESEKPDYIINLIGTFQSTNFDTLLDINAGIPQRLLESICKAKIKIKKVLLIGSAAEYGFPSTLPIREDFPLRPVNWYGLTKVVQTDYARFYCLNHSIPINMARTFNIIGKGLSPALSVGAFIARIVKAKNGDKIDVGNIDTKRDFLDIEDVIDAYWKLLLNGRSGEIYNVCRGESHYIKEILANLIKISEKAVQVNINKDLFKVNDVLDIFGDNSKLRKATNWQPKIGIVDSLVSSF